MNSIDKTKGINTYKKGKAVNGSIDKTNIPDKTMIESKTSKLSLIDKTAMTELDRKMDALKRALIAPPYTYGGDDNDTPAMHEKVLGMIEISKLDKTFSITGDSIVMNETVFSPTKIDVLEIQPKIKQSSSCYPKAIPIPNAKPEDSKAEPIPNYDPSNPAAIELIKTDK